MDMGAFVQRFGLHADALWARNKWLQEQPSAHAAHDAWPTCANASWRAQGNGCMLQAICALHACPPGSLSSSATSIGRRQAPDAASAAR